MFPPNFATPNNSVDDGRPGRILPTCLVLTCSAGEVGAGLLVGFIASRLGLPVVFVVGGSVLLVVVIAMLFASRAMLDKAAGRR